MGKPSKSISDAIQTAKALRAGIEIEELADDESGEAVEVHKVGSSKQRSSFKAAGNKSSSSMGSEVERIPNDLLSRWVRHTVGLTHRTKLRLQDAVDGQKRKARYGELSEEEPRNEQEIVELGVRLALAELGY
ncbi:MAG: hypothetical protein RH917_20690 [Lacipirellulaceae bacterium]